MKALITAEWTEQGSAVLGALGYELESAGWGVTGRALGSDALIEAARGAELLLVEAETIDRGVLDALPDCRLIGVARGNPTDIDLDACTERGIPVLYAPDRATASVADFILGLVLASCRGIAAADRRLRSRGWAGVDDTTRSSFRGPELAGRTLGLVGFGEVGRAIAQRAEFGFDMKVVFHEPGIDGSVELDTLLSHADIVSVHAAAEGADPLLGADQIALLKPTAYLINTSPGGNLDEAALAEALRAGRIAGAALDSFAVEPLPTSSPLRTVDNLVLTPHLAAAAGDVVDRHTAMLCEDVARVGRGEPALWCANPEVFAAIGGLSTIDLRHEVSLDEPVGDPAHT